MEVGRSSKAFVTSWAAKLRLGIRPNRTAKCGEENWWRSIALMKTSLCGSWFTAVRQRWNKFGSDSSGIEGSTISFGLTTQFQSTSSGLRLNRMESPGSHAATCGLGTQPPCRTKLLVTGMIFPAESTRAILVDLSVRCWHTREENLIAAQDKSLN